MASIDGTAGNDSINGTAGDDEIYGLAGDDEIAGGDGYDLLYGGTGNDTFYGGTDTFDDMFGGSGSDTLYGGPADDNYLYGGDDADLITDGIGSGSLDGGAGSDSLYAGGGNDTLEGGDGSDTLHGGNGNDSLYAGLGDDIVFGGAGDDLIQGQEGDDTLYGGTGADTFQFAITSGNDSIEGGEGSGPDTLQFFDSADTTITFDGSESGAASIDASTTKDFIQIEQFITAGGNDTIDGTLNAAGGTYFTNAGNDSITVGSGNDSIDAGDGNDTVIIGGGDNFASGAAGSADRIVFSGSYLDYTYDIDGSSRLIVTETATGDVTTIDTFEQITFDEGTFDLVTGTTGVDAFSPPGAGATFIVVGDGADSGGGTGANDVIYGGDGVDNIGGGLGDDTIFGGTGNDAMGGDAGNDTLTGGSGNDTFTHSRFGGDDVVTDFDTGDSNFDGFYNDQLNVSALQNLDTSAIRPGDVLVSDDGFGNALLTFPEGETLTLQGVAPSQMSTNAQKFAAGIPCFTVGTLIETPSGPRRIEGLQQGDLVQTRDNGPQPVIWQGQSHLNEAHLRAAPHLRPIRFAAGFAKNERPLLVSPQHGVLMHDAGGGGREAFARAIHLARAPGGAVRVANGVRHVTYVHILLPRHAVVMTEGIASESFYPGPWGLAALAPATLLKLHAALPTLCAPDGYGPAARAFFPAKRLIDSQCERYLRAA